MKTITSNYDGRGFQMFVIGLTVAVHINAWLESLSLLWKTFQISLVKQQPVCSDKKPEQQNDHSALEAN